MTDEKYLFVSDCRDKKRTARGAHHKRGHTGRGGVKMPSDYKTRKEREAMSGECKSYRLNEPMSWVEFLQMPEEIQANYIKLLRERFGASDSKIFAMMGVHQRAGSYYFTKKGLGRGRNCERLVFHENEWLKWIAGIKHAVEPIEDPFVIEEPVVEELAAAEPCVAEAPAAPVSFVAGGVQVPNGSMMMRGTPDEIGALIAQILGDKPIECRIEWMVAV